MPTDELSLRRTARLAAICDDMLEAPLLGKLRAEATQLVCGEGDLQAKVAVVGEAPGEQEDLAGQPFVGKAGQLLDELLQLAGLSRDYCWVTNVVKYRPRDNRTPTALEAYVSTRFLKREIQVIRPLLVVLCGRVASHAFFPSVRLHADHGRFLRQQHRLYLPVYHPAACLRDPRLEELTRYDFSTLLVKTQELRKN